MGAGHKLKSHHRTQWWADKSYKRCHLGNEWKKPFASSSHGKKPFEENDEVLIVGFGRKGHAIEFLFATSLVKDFSIKGFLSCKMSGGPGLESLVEQQISVITNDGRNIVGVLKGFDQATNIILDESHERVYSTKEGVQQLVLGLYIIRGDNISIVGEVDEELDSHLDLSNLRAHPLKPVIH
ncbi:hypothetical protein WN944_015090 [Citrus x changshan-huyou]